LVNTTAMLEEMGHFVLEAGGAKEAFAKLERNPDVDLVITDHAMPDMTGAELASTLKRKNPGLAVLLVTGYAELPGDVDPTLPKLAKPFTIEQLAEAVSQMSAPTHRPEGNNI
jgi:CheY-like chemotaxis protein